jgi:phage shock protein PspC (stress-responsive transcriptional regulator)
MAAQVPRIRMRGIAPWDRVPRRSKIEDMSELRRPRTGRVIGGVCAALATRFGWDVTLVRVLAVLSLFLPGPQLLFYAVAWIVIPNEGARVPAPVPATPHAG